MRAPVFRGQFALPGELVIDSFAGGGGASTGIEAAINRPVDIAINHSPEAIAMHCANHPETKHYCEDIWEVDPREACAGRPVGLAWFSPDCTHFSRAKGTQPVKKEIRGLAWVVVRWAEAVRPRTILLENVEEFATWGPVVDGRPDPARMGETFREWTAKLSSLGYSLEFRTLVAADYGAPTTRKRLFLIARRDETGIVWPQPTHGAGRPAPWRPAAEIIDWRLPCPSIFERKRPLAEATLKRIAVGIRRYILEAANPFVIPLTHQGDSRANTVAEPLRTVTAAHRGELALCEPFVTPVKSWGGGGNGPRSASEPLRTVTASKRGEYAVVEPFVVRHGHYSHRTGAGDTMRGQRLDAPLGTVCGTNDKNLVLPVVTKHFGGPNGHATPGHRIDQTLGTVTARDHHALTAAFLTKFFGTSTGSDVRAPVPTVTAGGGHGGGHLAEVRAFLLKYYGGDGKPDQQQDLFAPLHTVTSKARFGLVTIAGEQYEIADIGMRMLAPHELFAAQGFPADYEIAPEFNGKPMTKTAQIALAGNSVCPDVAEALVRANVCGGQETREAA